MCPANCAARLQAVQRWLALAQWTTPVESKRLLHRNGAWHVEDLGTTNGTQLDGHRLTGAQPVTVGSTLRIGRTTIELRG